MSISNRRLVKNCIVFVLMVAFLTAAIGMSSDYTIYTVAASIEELQQKQQETQEKINSVDALKKEAEAVLKALQGEANSLEGKYADYNTRLKKITTEISSAEKSIDDTQNRIADLKMKLEQAEADEVETKELMKAHIQYMYENNSNQSLFLSLLASDSMTTFLKRAEYTASIIRNDQDLIDKFQKQQEEIKQATVELQQKEVDLQTYQDTLTAQVDDLKALTEEAKQAYQEKTGEVYTAQGTVDDYDAMMKELEREMASYQAQQAQAQMELAKQLAEQETPDAGGAEGNAGTDGDAGTDGGNVVDPGTSGGSGAAYGAGDSERMLLAACIQAEAWGEGTAGQLAVGSVIMNRVEDSRFPGSITGVVTQSGQFASYPGPINRILERGVAPECLAAADQVLGGYRSGNWLFFMTQPYADKFGITGYTMIGNHAFFYRWGAN